MTYAKIINNKLLSQAKNDESSFSVLLVDDSLVSLRGMERLLKDVPTEKASNATEAIEKLTNHSYSIIITDCDMPGKDGIWLLEQVKKLSPDTHRILASAGLQERFIKHIKTGLIHGYLDKPVNIEKLNVVLSKVLVS